MPGFARVYVSLLLGRIAGQVVAVAFVLFVLARYHSPQLAGVTAAFAILPGLAVSPLAGALLDRYGRTKLVILDYGVAALTLVLVAGLSRAHLLPPPLLLLIVGVASLTSPLSATGARTMFPILVPRHLWERANALDSSGHVLAMLVGAPLGGTMVGLLGGEWALAATATLFALAALAMLRVKDPLGARDRRGPVLRDAWLGLAYVLRNSSLRGLALTVGSYNLAWGLLNIAVPVLVLGRLHQGPASVGLLWGAFGFAGLASALFTGRLKTEGRERQLMAGSMLVCAVAMALLPFAASLPVAAVSLVVMGLANGPLDVGLFTLRQRRTDPALFGRAFAVSMSVNAIGIPIGSAFAGPLIGWSLDATLWIAVATTVVAVFFPLFAIPARSAAAPGGRVGQDADQAAEEVQA